MKGIFAIIAAGFSFLPSLAGATMVDLFLEADAASAKLDSVSLEDPRLGQATPVLDEAKAALGWHFADFQGEVDGYVPDAKIGKDLLPVENAVIFSAPSTEAPVLGIYKDGDLIEVIDIGAWWKLRYGGGFPVYFVLQTPPPLPPVTAEAEAAPLALAAAPAAPVIVDEQADTSPASGIVSMPEDSPPPPGVVGQRYEGTFKRSKPFLGLIKPKTPFYLEGAGGDRLAWVDTSGIVVPGSMKDFLDKQVIIHGERTQADSSTDWIIQARNMRLK